MIFVNHAIGRFIGKVNVKFMAAKDARIRLISDLVYSMRFVKMQAWESVFKRKVAKLRAQELGQLAKVTLSFNYCSLIRGSKEQGLFAQRRIGKFIVS